jgi:hypothetical protein
MSLSLPVRVQGHDPDGSAWEEMTSASDVSAGGISFLMRRRTVMGQTLHLSLPLPKNFRKYDFMEGSYRVYALVRDVRVEGQSWRVGAMFLGKQPPKGLADGPGVRFRLGTDPERRRDLRREVFLNLRLATTRGAPQEERTVAENLSKHGARVLTSLKVHKGDVLMVEELSGGFRSRAEVRNVYVGQDRVPRLNLRFIDAEIPDRLIS